MLSVPKVSSRSEHQPDIDAAMPATGVIAIPGGRKKSVMAAGRGARVIVSIAVGGVIAMIVTVIVAVLVIAMLIRTLFAMLVRVVVRAYQGWNDTGDKCVSGE
jgi:hypothetical protein